MAKLEGAELIEGHHWGQPPDGPITIGEHGIEFQIDLREGQKTGFYLDQRENRRAAAAYLRGRRVLDLFCYTGGFSLAAAKLGGAKQTLGIDGSKRAIAQAVDCRSASSRWRTVSRRSIDSPKRGRSSTPSSSTRPSSPAIAAAFPRP
jgi:SAM-dependent methyltransferase